MTAVGTSDGMVYVDSDIPPGMTIHEWRRQRWTARTTSRHRRLASLAFGLVAGAWQAVPRPGLAGA